MRTLNRPMFRYGGPIKEGVMNGIRENKRHGGSMGNNLVGSPAYPKTDGREHHFAVTGTVAGIAAANAARVAAMRAGARYLPRIAQGIKRIFGTTAPASVTRATHRIPGASGSYSPVTMNPAKFNPNWLGRDPIIKGLGWAGKTLTSGPAKGIAGKVLQFGTAPTTLIGGLWFANGRWFNKDGSPANKKSIAKAKASRRGVSGAPGGGDPDMTYTAPEKELTAAETEAIEAENRIKQMEKYKEIMDIKGMSKDATYKSLVDASKIIQEGGNLKEQIKDGSLITKLIGATSKRFDKVSDTESALRSLVAKGEIQKDMNKEDKALANELTRKRIEVAEKQLKGDTLMEKIAAYTLRKEGTPPSGATLSSILRTDGVDVTETVDTTTVMNWIGKNKGKDEIDYMQSQVDLAAENGTKLEAGTYVIRDRIVIIDENGNVKKYH